MMTVIKTLLLWFTVAFSLLYMMVVDSLSMDGVFIGFCFMLIMIGFCMMVIEPEELKKLTFKNLIDKLLRNK